MRTALRTALAAALVAGAAATPVLAAGSAFAAGTAPAPKPTATAAPSVTAASPTAAAPTAAATEPAVALTDAAGATADAAPSATPSVAPVRTVPLAGGLSAKLYHRGQQHRYYTATVIKGGKELGELKAGGGYASEETKVFAGYKVTLTFEGKVTATAVETGPGTATGTLVRTETLMTGTVAKIYKVKEQNYRAELFYKGAPVGVLRAVTRSVASQNNGEFFVLNPDGTTHNWAGNIAPSRPGIYRLVNGTVLELGKKDGAYGLQLIDPATDLGHGYVYAHGDRKVFHFGAAVVVLEVDGQFAAYVPGSAKQAAPQPYGMGSNGQGESAPVDTDPDTLGACTITRFVDIGAGTGAKLIMSPKGPKAKLITAGDNKVIAVLDRAHPALPKSAGIIARIVDPYSATPSLYTKTQGGGAKGGTQAFPKLPKGCKLNAVPGAPGRGATPQGGQTSVIPKGGVAAGAELAAESSATPVAVGAGAGAAALAAAGLGFTVLRRRAAGARG
ncbi:hypothetical protein ACFFTQ_16270 [Streptomyces roseofulvus]|uniref:hypothetical protein n=1 Tax=Streptomyces roseofulvus TaxID=33902 RepID=UPI0031FD0C8A